MTDLSTPCNDLADLPLDIRYLLRTMISPSDLASLGRTSRRSRRAAGAMFQNCAYIAQTPTSFGVYRASDEYPTEHIFARSTIPQECRPCKCSSDPKSKVDNTNLAAALRQIYESAAVTDCAIEAAGSTMMWDLKAFMRCDLLDFIKGQPTLFVMSGEDGGIQKFVNLSANANWEAGPGRGRESEGAAEEQSRSTLGSAMSFCGKVLGKLGLGGGSSSDSQLTDVFRQMPAEEGTHFYLGTLQNEKKMEYDVCQFVGETVVDRLTGYTNNHITILDPLRYFAEDGDKTEEEAREAIWRAIRGTVGISWWRANQGLRVVSEEEELEIKDYVERHVHFMSLEDYANTPEGAVVGWQLRKMVEARE